MTDATIRAELRKRVQSAGSQKALAAAVGCSTAYLHDVLHGRRAPGPVILRFLGLVKSYERKGARAS